MKPAVTVEPKSKKSEADVSPEAPSPEASPFGLQAIYGAPAGMPAFLALGLQRKLTVGSVDDPLEREADQVAELVMRSSDSSAPLVSEAITPAAYPHHDFPFSAAPLRRKCACGGNSSGECEECRKREEEQPGASAIQRSVGGNSNGNGGSATHRPGGGKAHGSDAAEAPAIVHEALRSPGQPLDASVRPFMESRFGRDLSDVRVHTDSLASKSAQAVNALAYTAGPDVVFAPGQYSPKSDAGTRLLAHELTHVVQSGGESTTIHPSVIRRQPPPAPSVPPPAPTTTTAPPPSSPSTAPLSDQDKSDLETLKAVLDSKNGNDIYKIRNPNVANDEQKIGIIRIACGMNFPFSAAVLGQWWSSFEDRLPEVATTYLADWTNSVRVDSGLEYLRQVKKTQDAFLAEIDNAATQNLWDNRNYIMARKEALGLQPGSSKDPLTDAQKAEWRHQIQDMAWQVWEFKQAQAKLRKTIVGYTPMAWAPPDPIYFNPDHPQYDRFKGVHGTRPEWDDLKLAWDLLSAEIARIAAKYPEIYGALASEKPDDELLNMSRLIPGAFEKNTARLLDEMLVRIEDTQKKLGNSIAYLDLQPLVRRLLQGGPAPSGRKWGVGFDHWAADKLVGNKEDADKAADTAATALEVIGLLVATFASGGLALLVGGTLAVGIPVARGISDWSKANELDQAAKSTPMAGTDIVAQAQADSLKAKAVGEIIRGVFNAITLGGAAAWQAIRGAMTAAKLARIGELSSLEAADLLQKAVSQLGPAKTVASSGKTIEELLAMVGDGAAAAGPLRAYNAELLAKPFSELTPAELAASEALQNRVFNMAVEVQARQQALADQILAKLGQGGTAKSILKRPDLKSFVDGVVGKTGRGGYARIERMDDIVRGRFDMPTQKGVEAVAKALREQSAYEVVEVTEPRVAGGIVKYPRYHVILRDAATGMRHEWQVGTKALTELFEEPGIAIPEELANAAERMGKAFDPNLHDIEYDVFQSINKTSPAVSAKYGLPDFIRKVALASQKAGAEGAAFKDLPQVSAKLHEEAGNILAQLVRGEGAEWVAQFFH